MADGDKESKHEPMDPVLKVVDRLYWLKKIHADENGKDAPFTKTEEEFLKTFRKNPNGTYDMGMTPEQAKKYKSAVDYHNQKGKIALHTDADGKVDKIMITGIEATRNLDELYNNIEQKKYSFLANRKQEETPPALSEDLRKFAKKNHDGTYDIVITPEQAEEKRFKPLVDYYNQRGQIAVHTTLDGDKVTKVIIKGIDPTQIEQKKDSSPTARPLDGMTHNLDGKGATDAREIGKQLQKHFTGDHPLPEAPGSSPTNTVKKVQQK